MQNALQDDSSIPALLAEGLADVIASGIALQERQYVLRCDKRGSIIEFCARHDLLIELRESTTSSASKEEMVADFERQGERWQANFERYLKPWIEDSTVEVKNVPPADISEDSSSGMLCLLF